MIHHTTTSPRPSSSVAVRAEAAAWIARLHSHDRSTADEQSFRRWLAANATHAAAFEQITELWEAGAMLKSDALVRAGRSKPGRSGFYRPLAIAAAAILCVGAGLYLQKKGVESTRIGEQRILTLEDGTRVTLNTATRLKVRYDDSRRRVELEAGEALFEVVRQPARPFTVTVGGKQIAALGTAFVVRQDPVRLSIILVEGKVAVSSAALTDSIVMAPGQRWTFLPEESPQLDYPSLDKVTAWRRGLVALNNMTLADAIAEMNRYSTVSLVAIGLSVEDIRVSGMFRAGDSVEFARALALTHDLSVDEGSRRIVLSVPPLRR